MNFSVGIIHRGGTMKKNRTIDFTVVILTALIMLGVMTFTLGSLESSGGEWFVKPDYIPSNEKYVGESVILECADDAETVKKIYVRIGKVYNSDENAKIKLTIDVSSSKEEILKYGKYVSMNRTEKYIESKENRSFAPGWYILGDDFGISYKFIKITTSQSFDFDEIILLDKNDKRINAECIGGFIGGKFKSVDEYPELAAVCDGQNAFAFNSKNILSDKEESILGLARNLYSYEGYYLSEKATPLGALICCLGTVFFGNSAFGMRFMPFLFTFATLISVYFFAKKLFGSELYGIFAEVVWLLCGMCLALCGTGYPTAIALFFVVWAYYNAYVFYTDKSDSHRFYRYRSLFICGVLISFAGAVDIFALTALPALLFFCLFASIKEILSVNKEYKSASGLQKEYLREQYTKTLSYSIIGNALSLVAMPCLYLLISYGIFTPIYTDYYGTGSIISAMFSNLSAIVAANNGSFVLGWLVGLSSETATGIAPRIISANKAMIAACFALELIFSLLYILNAKKKITNRELAAAISTDFKTKFILLAFVLTYVTGLIGGFFADYSSFAYSLLFLVFALPCSYNLYKKNVNGMAFGLSFSVICALSVVFFLLSLVCFVGIDIPQNVARYLYGWTL